MRPIVQITVRGRALACVSVHAQATAKTNARVDVRETVLPTVQNYVEWDVAKPVKADARQNVLLIVCLDVKNNVLLHVEERVQWVVKALVDVVVAVVAATHAVVVVVQTVVAHAKVHVVMVALEVA